MPSTSSHYRERQYFRQDWLWALLLVSSVPALVVAGVAIVADSGPGTDVALWLAIVTVLVLGPLVGFYFASMTLRVTDDGLAIRLVPLHLRPRTIPCSDIRAVHVVEISPLGDFGGLGVRYNPTLYRWGVRFDGPLGYIVSGTQGVRIERRDSCDVVVTSKDARTLSRELERRCA